jgi:hypothetical protein
MYLHHPSYNTVHLRSLCKRKALSYVSPEVDLVSRTLANSLNVANHQMQECEPVSSLNDSISTICESLLWQQFRSKHHGHYRHRSLYVPFCRDASDWTCRMVGVCVYHTQSELPEKSPLVEYTMLQPRPRPPWHC